MTLKMIRSIVHVDKNHQRYIDVPPNMDDEIKRIPTPLHSHGRIGYLSCDDQFNLATHATAVEEDEEEDII